MSPPPGRAGTPLGVAASPPSDQQARRRRPGRVSVIMPVRDAAATVAEQLSALAGQTYAGWWELVVADNGSGDDTVAVVETWAARLPRVRVVDAGARKGINYARNAGVAASTGQLLLFCDGDDVVSETWIDSLVAAAAEADLVGGHLDLERLNPAPLRHWRGPITAGGLPRPMGLWHHILGANFAIWRDQLQAAGGFDDRYTDGGDDVCLSWQVQLAGGTVTFAPEAVVHYRLRSSLGCLHRQLSGHGAGAALLYREFRHYGAERPPLPGTVKYWLRLLQRAPRQLATPGGRGRWVCDASYHWGRLRGALRYRVMFW